MINANGLKTLPDSFEAYITAYKDFVSAKKQYEQSGVLHKANNKANYSKSLDNVTKTYKRVIDQIEKLGMFVEYEVKQISIYNFEEMYKVLDVIIKDFKKRSNMDYANQNNSIRNVASKPVNNSGNSNSKDLVVKPFAQNRNVFKIPDVPTKTMAHYIFQYDLFIEYTEKYKKTNSEIDYASMSNQKRFVNSCYAKVLNELKGLGIIIPEDKLLPNADNKKELYNEITHVQYNKQKESADDTMLIEYVKVYKRLQNLYSARKSWNQVQESPKSKSSKITFFKMYPQLSKLPDSYIIDFINKEIVQTEKNLIALYYTVTDVARDLLGIDEKEFNKKFSKINQTSTYLVYDAINQAIKEEQQEVSNSRSTR